MEEYNAKVDSAKFTAWLEFFKWLREANEAQTGAEHITTTKPSCCPMRSASSI